MEEVQGQEGQIVTTAFYNQFCTSRTLSLIVASLHMIISGLILVLISFPVLSEFDTIADINTAVSGEPAPFQFFLVNFHSGNFYKMLTSAYVSVFLWYLFWFIWGVALFCGVKNEHRSTLNVVSCVKFMKIIGSLMAFFVTVLTVPSLLLSFPLLILVISVYFMPLPFNLLLFPVYLWAFGPEVFLWVLGSALLDYQIILILNDFQAKLKQHSE